MEFSKEIYIGKRKISPESPVFIIAEAGVNHNGDMSVAKELIDIAVSSGADAVKFQAFKTENLILEDVEKASYQKEITGSGESQFEMLKRLEVSKQQNRDLMEYCHEQGITFLTTPFDEESLDELDDLNLPAYKVASTDTTNLPFLRRIAQKGKPMFLSSGMSYFEEVRAALEEINTFNKDVVLLQCTANYPIRDEEANLAVISTYITEFDMLVGYSDHSVGIGASPYAIPMGACVVEKHFTIDKLANGPDHSASLSPEELTLYVQQIRKVEKYMGTAEKAPSRDEEKTRLSLQKSLVALLPIKKGEAFTFENIVAKRTGGKGISPIRYKDLLNKKASQDYKPNDIIDE